MFMIGRSKSCRVVGIVGLFALYLIAPCTWAQTGTGIAGKDDQKHGSKDEPVTQVINLDSIDFATYWGLQQTGVVNASFTSFGQFGLGFLSSPPPIAGWPQVDFESPSGTGITYLYAGAIWVGGIIGADTLVSVGFDGWQMDQQLYPPHYGDKRMGSVTPITYGSAFSYRSEFSDTVQTGIKYPNDWSGSPYNPLHINLVNRSYTFRQSPENNVIIYDLTITNVGNQRIEKGYVGFYLDGDVGYVNGQSYSHVVDDISGAIRSEGIAYIADNDGDPSGGSFTQRSCTKLLALKILGTSFNCRDTSFNWWISSQDHRKDYGPMRRANYRNFGTGGMGTPEGDANKYYMMSNGEWDFDQVFTASIQPTDSVWICFPSGGPIDFSYGYDIKFLYSFGPFDLEPDSSVRVLYTLFTADSVQVDPNIGRFIRDSTYEPDQYVADLNFTHVIGNAQMADTLVKQFTAWDNQVTGLRLLKRDADSVVVEWDPWVLNNTDGHGIYLTQVPESAFPLPGIVAPWYRPQYAALASEVGRVHRYTFKGIDPLKWYVVNVANRVGSDFGMLSDPLIIRGTVGEPTVPIVSDTIIFAHDANGARVAWSPSGGAVHHYNIYWFADSVAAGQRYLPFYSSVPRSYTPRQIFDRAGKRYYYYALTPLASVPDTQTSFQISTASTGNWVAVTAVDSAGYETQFSRLVRVIDAQRSRDILIITNSNPTLGAVSIDSVEAFYDSVLAGYSHDFYNWVDTVQNNKCVNMSPYCVHWSDFMRYRMIIIDDDLRDDILDSWYEKATDGFARYLLSGGRIAYCGAFNGFRSGQYDVDVPPATYATESGFVQRFFGVDSVFYFGHYYYMSHGPTPGVDSIYGFTRAEASHEGLSDMLYDQSRYPFYPEFREWWPTNSPPSVSTFRVNSRAIPLFTYRSQYPALSVNEGQVVGVMTDGPEARTYLFGFHLWYMNYAGARALIDWMMGQTTLFGERAEAHVLPTRYALGQNYPNPFNPATTITYELPRPSHVTIDVFNILGQKVRTLVDEARPAGTFTVIWKGEDDRGRAVASGVYLYRLRSDQAVLTRKMILMK